MINHLLKLWFPISILYRYISSQAANPWWIVGFISVYDSTVFWGGVATPCHAWLASGEALAMAPSSKWWPCAMVTWSARCPVSVRPGGAQRKTEQLAALWLAAWTQGRSSWHIMAQAQEETKHVFNSHKILMILLWNSPWNFLSTGGELQQLWHFSGLRTWEPHSHKLPVSEYPTLWITKNATNPGDCCDTMGGLCELRMPQASSKKNHQNCRNCLPKLSMRMFITDKHPNISGTLQQSNMAMDHLL